MTVEQFYAITGGDYNDARDRLMNDALITKFVRKFADDKSYKTLMSSIEANNIEESFKAAHTLKGVAGNLGFTALFKVANALTEQLRALNEAADTTLTEQVTAAYNLIIENIPGLD